MEFPTHDPFMLSFLSPNDMSADGFLSMKTCPFVVQLSLQLLGPFRLTYGSFQDLFLRFGSSASVCIGSYARGPKLMLKYLRDCVLNTEVINTK
jgi:hypothetical protein